MKSFRLFLYIFLLTFALSSCYDAPEFAFVPELTGDVGLVYEAVPDAADTLTIRVNFQDGDGDLGLYNNEALDPPSTTNLIVFPPGPNGEKYRVFDASTDQFNCKNFQYFDTLGTDAINDTVAIEYNNNYYNFDIELQVKRNGVFEVFDFRSPPFCATPLSGRFPPLKKEGFDNNKPLEGVIEYTYSPGGDRLLSLFRNDTLRIAVQIRDRALNESNIKVSDPFTLKDITQGSNTE